ncbi:RHS repeat-associated core domain-containing protein [Actinomadura atramentaria]|uniref:RHS repeat-associated core domain-containing protein n=1 Tax=Actinomadura atramentaria TaxID=1990 RepID=UPI00039A24F4|nr:RHS repeat-associated core domain-containing protein [Actinomadura atramentaria]
MPVFGDDDAEPCHQSSGFAASWCQQAYRWNLDYVVDPNGNALVYNYTKETNHYGRNLKSEDETPYTRGGYLNSISYGLRKTSLFADAPARVVFDTSERCKADSSFDCDASKIGDKPSAWMDVPWDLHCDSGQKCEDPHGSVSPTFWSRKRLTKVTTQILKPDASGYRPVDSWTLDHSWGLADVDRDLRLDEIRHTGHAADGTTMDLPKVTFNHVQLANRLDKTGDDILPYIRYRVGAIYDESGGQLDITYSDADCSLTDLPVPETNERRCFPVIWAPPGREDPITDWFHKYVVTAVTQVDRTGLSPNMVTKYEYLGGGAWHYDDDDGLTKEKYKTWSQWRGYGQVRTLTGDFAAPASQSDVYYLRGMDGDRKNKDGGTKSVTVSDGEGGDHLDHDALAGFELKSVTYTAPGGTIFSKTVNKPWRVQTASRARSWGTTTANVVNVDTSTTWTAKDGGGWTETRTDTDFESSGPGVGRPKTVNDLGDVSTDADDQCVRTTYTDNTGAHIVSLPSRKETVATECGKSATRPAQVISDVRYMYDGGEFGDAPTRGLLTKGEKVASYSGGTPVYVTDTATTYDAYGRSLKVTNALGQATMTAYTDVNGLVGSTTTTTPPATAGDAATALTSKEELDPASGQPIAKIDANNLRTDLEYDPLGRLSKVWLPDRSKKNGQNPNFEYGYKITDGEIAAVTTKTLTATGSQRVSNIELLDGWLRVRQTQAPTSGGRIIADTFYDSRGQVTKTYAPYPATGTPSTNLFGIDTPGAVDSQSRTSYDGLGRKTLERLMTGNGDQPEAELWRTTYAYGGGNRSSVTPPSGGTPFTEITNARGQTIEHREYQGSTPTGAFDVSRYTYTPAGQVETITDAVGNVFTHEYDLRGRQTKATDPDTGTTTFTYDDLDRQVSTTDARGTKLFTIYDGVGRRTEIREGSATGSVRTTWTYDTAPRGKGLVATSIQHEDDGDYTTAVRNYDVLGRVAVSAITVPSSQGPLAGTYTFSTTYNLDGTVKGQGLPAAGGLPAESLAFGYDDYLRPVSLKSPQFTYVGGTVYTPTGKTLSQELGAEGKRVWETFSWEPGTQRLAETTTLRENIAGATRKATYHYADSGDITSIIDQGADGTDNQCFSYDYQQRLAEAWTQNTDTCASTPTASVIAGPAPYWQTFSYDKIGNRTSETRHGIGGTDDTVRTYTYPPAGQGSRLAKIVQAGGGDARTDLFDYDDTGRMTSRTLGTDSQALAWNAEGRLTKATSNAGETSFVYDADGNRVIRKDPTGTTLYLPGMELRATSGSPTASGTRYYTYAAQTVAMRTADGTVTFLVGDHQGTAQLAVNASTQESTTRRFTPFGSERGFDDDATWPNDKGFVGGTKDPTGLTHLGAREYDPETGRFVSVDPVFNTDNTQSWNGYAYANDNPVTASDPTGLDGALRGNVDCLYANKNCDKPVPRDGWQHDRPSYPVIFPALPEGKRRQTAYRRQMDMLLNGPLTRPDDIKRYFQSKLAFCSEFPGESNCSGEKNLHAALDAMGMAGLDEADVVNAVYYGFEGDWKNAIISGIAIVPILGNLATAKRLARASKAAGVVDCNSFVSGTQVMMADGEKRPIEDVKAGEAVLASDPETGEVEVKTVLATIVGGGDKDLVEVSVDTMPRPLVWPGGEMRGPLAGAKIRVGGDEGTGIVIATGRHPFWVAGGINSWVNATDLRAGMWLRTSAGTYVQVTAVKRWTAHHQRVHNLTIADLHTYYALAGNTPVLVHNAGPCDIPWSSPSVSRAAKAIEAGSTSIRVGSRDEAGELFLGMFQGRGYRNATGFDGVGTKRYFGSKSGTYHWDDQVGADGRVLGHGSGNRDGDLPHLQIHTFEDSPWGGAIIRIFW